MSGPVAPRRPRGRPVRDPYGLLPGGLPIAAVVSVAGLLLVGIVTVNLMNGRLPFVAGGAPGASGGPAPITRTPTPSNVVVVPDDPRANVPGTLVYAKAGNIWLQAGAKASQLTAGGEDSMPTFSPDGAFVYFVRTREERGLWPAAGSNRYYRMAIPSLMRVPVDRSAPPERVFDGRVRQGRLTWFGWIRQPAVSPDGTAVALLTDLPDPTKSDVVLQILDLATGELTKPKVAQVAPLGHQDPAWRPDGRILLYVKNSRDGARGTPEIWSYSLVRNTPRLLSTAGYLQPAWSPDAKWLAATKTSAFGTDVVILNAQDGSELLRITSDGDSWAPVWSPAGDGIVFLHVDGQVVDLRLVPLEGRGPTWTAGEALDLTLLSGLDSGSRPGWFIPPAELPATPAPTLAPSPAPSAP